MSTKSQALGMPHGTARNRLLKSLLFNFVKATGNDICYRCNLAINTEKEFSIEHKISWQNSEKPLELFLDLTNIAYSHLSCNIAAARLGTAQEDCSKRNSPKPNCGCALCKELDSANRKAWWRKMTKEERVAYRRDRYLKQKNLE